ncbi:hypothetical protein KY360_00675 [Candidatus Woesearchaeota archaeon]|nr:hypothetical protein [Candidatus Woesearchaeota archaeon]
MIFIKNEGNLDKLIEGGKDISYTERIVRTKQLKGYNKSLYGQVKKIIQSSKYSSIIEWGIYKQEPFIFQVRPAPENYLIKISDESIIPSRYNFLEKDPTKFEVFMLDKIYDVNNGPFIKALNKVLSRKSLNQIKKTKSMHQIFLNEYRPSFLKLLFFVLALNNFKFNLIEFLKSNLKSFKQNNQNFHQHLQMILDLAYYSTINNAYVSIINYLGRHKINEKQKAMTLPLEYFNVTTDIIREFNKNEQELYDKVNKRINKLSRDTISYEEFILGSKTALRDILNMQLIRFKMKYGRNKKITAFEPSLAFGVREPDHLGGRIVGYANFPAKVRGIIGKDILVMKSFDYSCFPFSKKIKAIIVEKSHCLSHPYILCKSHKMLFAYNLSNFGKLKKGRSIVARPLRRDIVEVELTN